MWQSAVRLGAFPTLILASLRRGSEGWSFPILQSCKIGTTSRVEKASEQTLVGLNMACKEKGRRKEKKRRWQAWGIGGVGLAYDLLTNHCPGRRGKFTRFATLADLYVDRCAH